MSGAFPSAPVNAGTRGRARGGSVSTDDEGGVGGGGPWVSRAARAPQVYGTQPAAMSPMNLSGAEDATPLLASGPGSAHQSLRNFATPSKFITPRDQYNSVYLSFVLLGAGFLFPWDAIITAGDYWNRAYTNPPNTFFYFTIAYMVPNLLGLVAIVNWGSRVSFGARIVPGFIAFIIMMMVMTLWKNAIGAIAICGALGFLDSIVQGSVYGLAGQFHPRFVGAVMAGNGVAGTIIAILRVVTKAVFPEKLSWQYLSLILYFSTASVALVGCIAAYMLVIKRSPVTKYYLEKATRQMRTNYVTGSNSNTPLVEEPVLTVAKAVAGPAAQAALNFWVTLAIFPGLIFQLRSSNPDLNEGLWFNTILVTLFNVFDLVGRTIVRWDTFVVFNRKTLWFLTVGRFIFVPFIVLSIPGTGYQIFKHDLWQYIGMVLFATTNGYVGTLAMMFGPELVDARSKERAGVVMVFCLTVGLTAGVITGTIINDLTAFGSILPPL